MGCSGSKKAQRDVVLQQEASDSSDDDDDLSSAGSEGAAGRAHPSPRRSPRGEEVAEAAQWGAANKLWGWCACNLDMCEAGWAIEDGAGVASPVGLAIETGAGAPARRPKGPAGSTTPKRRCAPPNVPRLQL